VSIPSSNNPDGTRTETPPSGGVFVRAGPARAAPAPGEAAPGLLDSLTTAVLALDPRLRLTAVNAAGEMLFATSRRQMLGQRFADLVQGEGALHQALADALAANHPIMVRGASLELPGGRAVAVDCAVTPLGETADAAIGDGAALLVELTRIDRLLRLTRDGSVFERQAANRALLRGLAHEIKNPLGGLRGAAQLLERELGDEGLKEYTQVIIREADRLRNLVDRMTGVQRPLARRPVNLHSVLEHVRLLLLAEVPAGLTIERDYDPSLPELWGDAEQLVQAALNVARNAVQALAGRGTMVLRTRVDRGLTIGARRYRLVLRAEIEDNGPGIPPELLEHVFDPLVTGRAEGTGLGLAIAQDIVTRHGGLIECDSRPGRTVFALYLPVEHGHD
jgi:two-component system nitrogen regulation sensor histidine kinase GlnL